MAITSAKQFRLALNKMLDEFVDDTVDQLTLDFDQYFESWAKDLQNALSVPAPEYDRRRWSATRDRRRLFPYTRSDGADSLKDSLVYTMDVMRTKKSILLKASVGFEAPQAEYTDLGIPAPKAVAKGAWVGWAKDIFFGEGRDGVKGVRNLFNEFTKRRRAL